MTRHRKRSPITGQVLLASAVLAIGASAVFIGITTATADTAVTGTAQTITAPVTAPVTTPVPIVTVPPATSSKAPKPTTKTKAPKTSGGMLGGNERSYPDRRTSGETQHDYGCDVGYIPPSQCK